jgi:hypothetical protein
MKHHQNGVLIRLNWRYMTGFAALTILCGTSHEFVHHFAAAGICGAFGTKTFNSFDLAPSCENSPHAFWATLAGPAFTFALMWVGMAMIMSTDQRRRQLGLALIFANFPVNRMTFVLFGINDEQWAAHHLFGTSAAAFWITVTLVWAACLPPLITAWNTLVNKPRHLWFAGLFLFPFFFVLLFGGLVLEQYLLLEQRVLASEIIGVPWLIVITEALCLVLYAAFKRDLEACADEAAYDGADGRDRVHRRLSTAA